MPEPSIPETPSARKRFRTHFYTGLLVLAPLWLTVYVIVIAVKLIGGTLSPYVRSAAISMFGHGTWDRPVIVISDIVAFVLTLLAIALIGYAVRKVVGRKLLDLLGYVLGRIPVVREVYYGVRNFLDVFFGDKSKFRRVVAVRYPTEQTWSIGFVTGEIELKSGEGEPIKRITVFIPKTPNPTNGSLVLCEPDEIVSLPLTVDEAIKLIVSGGTLAPGAGK